MIETKDIYEKLKNGDKISKRISYTHKQKTNSKSKQMSIGRVWLNTLLPDDFPLVNEVVNMNRLNELLSQIFKKYGPEKASTTIQKLQAEAFKLATISPSSFTVDSFIIPPEIQKKKDDLMNLKKDLSFREYEKKVEEVSQEFIKYIKTQGYSLDNILNSGMKGSALNDWKTMLISKGYMVDLESEIYGPVKHGSSEGYTGEEYYKAAAEARRGFFIKTTAVETPGYLSRKVVTANAGITLDNKDCRSKKYYDITVNNKNSHLIMGRFYMNNGELIEIKETKEIMGKTIKMRSPLYCKSKNGICKICYGTSSSKLKSNNLGLLAGGAINQVVVNACMNQRHVTSQVDIIDVNFPKILEENNIKVKEIQPLLDISETKIIAKQPCSITIDKGEYTEINLMNLNDKYVLPGLLDIHFGKGNNITSFMLPFNFKVNLMKSNDTVVNKKVITLNYEIGETIISKKQYVKDQDPAVIERLLEGQIRYIKDPKVLLTLIVEELPGIDLNHLELIVSNMFRDATDLSIPCRLSSYKNSIIVGQKQLPFKSGSWLNALAFENINKAVEVGLIGDKDAEMNVLEKIVMEESQSAKI